MERLKKRRRKKAVPTTNALVWLLGPPSLGQWDGLIPSISAAICWLFWEGSSRTVSRAVSPWLSFMLTSIPRKAHQVDQKNEHFLSQLQRSNSRTPKAPKKAQPIFFIHSHLIQLFRSNSHTSNQSAEHTYTGFKCSQQKLPPSGEAGERQSHPWHAV
jgi:hypothetical protein